MRRGTLVFLLLLIVLFALFGSKVLGWLVVGALLLLLLPFVVLAVGFWIVRRRIRLRLEAASKQFEAAFQARQAQHEGHAPSAGSGDVIDAEARELPDDGTRSP